MLCCCGPGVDGCDGACSDTVFAASGSSFIGGMVGRGGFLGGTSVYDAETGLRRVAALVYVPPEAWFRTGGGGGTGR